jgi:hypothetical protein
MQASKHAAETMPVNCACTARMEPAVEFPQSTQDQAKAPLASPTASPTRPAQGPKATDHRSPSRASTPCTSRLRPSPAPNALNWPDPRPLSRRRHTLTARPRPRLPTRPSDPPRLRLRLSAGPLWTLPRPRSGASHPRSPHNRRPPSPMNPYVLPNGVVTLPVCEPSC